MNYFDYCRLTGKDSENRDNFKQYLMDVLDYTEDEAERETRFMFQEKEN